MCVDPEWCWRLEENTVVCCHLCLTGIPLLTPCGDRRIMVTSVSQLKYNSIQFIIRVHHANRHYIGHIMVQCSSANMHHGICRDTDEYDAKKCWSMLINSVTDCLIECIIYKQASRQAMHTDRVFIYRTRYSVYFLNFLS